MNLGNPLTGAVDIPITEAEMPGLVWVHARTGQNTAISGDYSAPDDDKQTATRALLKPNTISDELKLYGTPVYVKQRGGLLEVTDLGGAAAVEYLFGVKARPQRSIDLSQFDYGLIRPTNPASPKLDISPFKPTLDSVAYDVPALQTSDLVAAYAGSLSTGQARAVMIELDPVAPAIYYTAGTAFTNTTHKLAFSTYYPKTVTRGRFLLGWVKLYYEMVSISINDIYHAQEIYSKDKASPELVLNVAVVAGGDVVTSGGQIVKVAL